MRKSKKKQQVILKKIDERVLKARILSALVPLYGSDPVPGHTREEFDVAYRAYQEIDQLTVQLWGLR